MDFRILTDIPDGSLSLGLHCCSHTGFYPSPLLNLLVEAKAAGCWPEDPPGPAGPADKRAAAGCEQVLRGPGQRQQAQLRFLRAE